jgi:hypothetical protein
MPLEEWALIWKCAPLHDIGKVGIPDQILLKPGPLDADEFEIMKQHTTLGRDALRTAELGSMPTPLPAHRQRNRLFASRALERHRLSAGPPRRGDPASPHA